MPKSLQYRAGSLIYFQGDEADKVFLLQTGKIHLVYQDIETEEDVHDLVQPGEFFGVKSALGRYPREENAVAMQDTTIMAFSISEFETLAMANTRIIMKMLKVFSNQLRRIHKQVSNLMEKDEQDPELGLFSVGEYYLKNKRFFQAKQVFSRYLTYYPAGKKAEKAAKYLEFSETAWAQQENAAPSANKASPAASGRKTSAASLSGSPDIKTPVLSDAAKAYYDAVSMLSQAKYQQAYLLLKRVMEANEDPEYAAKSSYEIGRCFYLQGKYADCIIHYTTMLTKYPKHPALEDALFLIGQSYEKNNRRDQAVIFYKKLLSIPGDDEEPRLKAQKALKDLGVLEWR
ncbi:MAG: cyclic nucleotide-binding domain-containing protein [Treponema sp.]|jgi:CRP-like cAMP-binding protein|nr:cyclic nucleotide-binding domain-containing protein [Treponema sp.]